MSYFTTHKVTLLHIKLLYYTHSVWAAAAAGEGDFGGVRYRVYVGSKVAM